MRLHIALVPFAWASLTSTAHAQSNLPDVTGRWSAGDCATSYYDWSREGDLVRFRDDRNRSYAERIIAGGPDGFTTMETVGSGGKPPARWVYQLTGPDTIAITNLATGRRFTQHRCAPVTPLPLNTAAPEPNRAGVRLGYSTALGVEILSRRPDWCAPAVALRVIARDPRVFADPTLAALLQRLGQSVLSHSCPIARSATFEGAVGDAPNGWQRTAAAAGGWAVADSSPTQLATGGVDLDPIPATPSPQPVAPFAPAQTPASRPQPDGIGVHPSSSLPGEVVPDGTSQASRSPPGETNPNTASLVSDPDPPVEPTRACPATYPGPENARVPMFCTCDASSLDSGTVIGTGVYGYASVVCRAARHADIIGVEGGLVLYIPLPGQTNLVASDRNGVSSGAGQGPGFRPYRPTPALAGYYRRWLDLIRQAANPISVRMADGRVLTPSMTYPPLPLDLRPAQPVGEAMLAMPGVNQMSLPVPAMPLAGEHLPPSPW